MVPHRTQNHDSHLFSVVFTPLSVDVFALIDTFARSSPEPPRVSSPNSIGARSTSKERAPTKFHDLTLSGSGGDATKAPIVIFVFVRFLCHLEWQPALRMSCVERKAPAFFLTIDMRECGSKLNGFPVFAFLSAT